MKTVFRVSLFVLLIGALPASTTFAGARFSPLFYEATTPPGLIELENTITWQASSPNDSRFNEVEFRHEVGFGITSNFQAAIYAAGWN